MRSILSTAAVLIGSFAGGVIPGAVLAFMFAAHNGFGYTVWIITNLILGILGALGGKLIVHCFQPVSSARSWILFPVSAGLVAGVTGLLWVDWLLSDANF